MDSRANGRLTLITAATVAYAAFFVTPLHACDSTRGCPSSVSELTGVAANALPTYPEQTTETPAEPVKLKKFTRSQSRSARRAQSRKANLAQRAQASKLAKAKQAEEGAAEAQAKPTKKVTFANANAEFVDASGARISSSDKASSSESVSSSDKTSLSDKSPSSDKAETAAQVQPATTETQTAAAQPPAVELVAAEQFNDLDRAAWDANQMPKLMQLTGSNSHAEFRDDDSRWAQTSMIGKVFVAFGALLTIGSAIRMFMA
jgi:hypothetical protein